MPRCLPTRLLNALLAAAGAALLLPRAVWAYALPKLAVEIPTAKFSEIGRTGETITIPWIAQYLVGFYQYGLGIGAAVAAVMMIAGGFEWMVGNPTGGKKRITNALVGLVILFGAYVILNVVNPEMTNLKAIQIQVIKTETLPFDEGGQIDAVGTPIHNAGGQCFEDTFGTTDAERNSKVGMTKIDFPFCSGGRQIILNKLAAPAFEAAFKDLASAPADSAAGKYLATLTAWSCSPSTKCPNVAYGGSGEGSIDRQKDKIAQYNALTLAQQNEDRKTKGKTPLTEKEEKKFSPVGSQHLYGNALDIDPCHNQYATGTRANVTTVPQEVVDIFAKHNIYWGGFGWSSTGSDPNASLKRDGMHFEWHGRCWN
jgi:hypothetical protein